MPRSSMYHNTQHNTVPFRIGLHRRITDYGNQNTPLAHFRESLGISRCWQEEQQSNTQFPGFFVFFCSST
jgi:hypothetical protein